MVTKFGPGTSVTVDGKSYVRVATSVTATIKGEKSSLESYTLYDPATFIPIRSFQPDGEITVYREVKAHPEFLKVGELALLSKSETFNPAKQKGPIYKTTTLLSLVRVQGETDLFEFCETDYEYRGSSRSKKADAELSSCLLINAKGEPKGYAETPTPFTTPLLLLHSLLLLPLLHTPLLLPLDPACYSLRGRRRDTTSKK